MANKKSASVSKKSGFIKKLEARWEKGLFVCVGLDTDYKLIPSSIKKNGVEESVLKFNKAIIDATFDLVCAYKPNAAFYEAQGEDGLRALKQTVAYLKKKCPQVPVILDAKRGDNGNTNLGYIDSAFDQLGADAITVHPYLGKEALQPFLDRRDKGIIVLARTSNPGAGEFQDLPVGENGEALYKVIARHVAEGWNKNGNCALVVGATYPEELAQVRAIVGNMPILIPGVGAQGGDVKATVNAGKDSNNMGMIINSSRGIIYASKGADFAKAARAETQKLNDEINKCLLGA